MSPTCPRATGEAFGLFTDEDDIVIRNGSVVEAFAEGAYSAGISTQNCEEGGAGGRMFVSESVVKAVARYLEGEGQDGGYRHELRFL